MSVLAERGGVVTKWRTEKMVTRDNYKMNFIDSWEFLRTGTSGGFH